MGVWKWPVHVFWCGLLVERWNTQISFLAWKGDFKSCMEQLPKTSLQYLWNIWWNSNLSIKSPVLQNPEMSKSAFLKSKIWNQFLKDFNFSGKVQLHLEEKPLEVRAAVRSHVFYFDVGQTMEQQQRETSNWLESLPTDKECLLCFLSTEKSFAKIPGLFSATHYKRTCAGPLLGLHQKYKVGRTNVWLKGKGIKRICSNLILV